MNKLYYGNGNCSITGENIIGVEINFKGTVSIDDKTPNNYALMQKKNKIIIFPYGEVENLSNLFDYQGEFKIISLIVADRNAERVSVSIQRVLDYSEFINSNSEDMTTKSEDLKQSFISKRVISKPGVNKKFIEKLHTDNNVEVYKKSGLLYEGEFKISLEDGRTRTPDGEELYYKAYGKLLSTKDDGKPPANILRRKAKLKREANNITRRRGRRRY